MAKRAMTLTLMMATFLTAACVAAAETKVNFDVGADLPKGW